MTALRIIGRRLKREALEIRAPRARRLFISIAKADFKETMKRLVKSKGFTHISTITGVDVGEEIEVIYHVTRGGLVLSLKVRVSKENPVLPTIVDLIPGSVFYEREVHDLFGVEFKGNPDMSPLVLPEGWPSDVHPLRREWTPEKIKRRMEEV